MTDYGTIKIPRDEYERHNQRRQDLGLSWADYIDGEAPEVRNASAGEVEVDTEGLVNDLVAQLPPKIAEELQ